jgi:hypothetical protein
LVRTSDALGDCPGDDELHHARIIAKQCRYAAMAVASVFGRPALDFARALGRLQDALGAHNDVRIMSERLRQTAVEGQLDAAVVFAAGEAVGRLNAGADETATIGASGSGRRRSCASGSDETICRRSGPAARRWSVGCESSFRPRSSPKQPCLLVALDGDLLSA